MGSDHFYAEERPVRSVSVSGFWIEVSPVTNRQFAAFVADTGHTSVAERTPHAEDYPDASTDALVAGSAVFIPTTGPVPLHDELQWWHYVEGACWRHPEGCESTLDDRDDHPVVHVALEDATAYAAWAGLALPTEAEWEVAARGGVDGAEFAWGDDPSPAGRANTWRGEFPWQSRGGRPGTTAVGSFPANGLGLYDMIGNVWEWTATRYREESTAPNSCCTPNRTPGRTARHVIKGGSFLCSPEYCLRYRPAARQGLEIDSSTAHLGFRCVARPAG